MTTPPPDRPAASDTGLEVPLTPAQHQRFSEAAERGLAPRRAILLLAAHAAGHMKHPHGDSCEECGERWPCPAVLRAASPALRAVENLTPDARVAAAEQGAAEGAAVRESAQALLRHFDEQAEWWAAEAGRRNDTYSLVHRDLYRYYSRDALTPVAPLRAALSDPAALVEAEERPRVLPTVRCGSCGQRATTTIILQGVRVPVCLRHFNVWRTPEFVDPEAEDRARADERDRIAPSDPLTSGPEERPTRDTTGGEGRG